MLHFSLKALQISIYNTHFQIITSQAQSYKSRRYFPKNSVFSEYLETDKKELKKRKKKRFVTHRKRYVTHLLEA